MELKRQRKTFRPCEICLLHRSRCICAQIPKLDLKTRVTLLIHAKEIKRTTNTGRLALHALTNSEMFIRGLKLERLDLRSILKPDYESCLLFPSDDAIPIEDFKAKKPVQLIVADGNWRQASKVNQRHPELAHLPRVKINATSAMHSTLRKEHFANGLATMEAIAIALRTFEGEFAYQAMFGLYQAKLVATLLGRGQTTAT